MLKLLVTCAAAAFLALPASAATLTWGAVLSGDQEIPPVPSAATGTGWVQYDSAANDLSLYVAWEGLTGPGIQAHIHCCVATPPGNVGIALDLWLPSDPSRPTSGFFTATYDLDTTNPFRVAFTNASGGTTAGALERLIAAMDAGDGRVYYNIHTAQYPGGEIRGNLMPVPEPATTAGLLAAVGAMLALRRRRQSRAANS